MEKGTFVLCICGCSCSGKTSIVKELLNNIPDAKSLHFDDYNIDFLNKDYYQWSINGNDYNEWDFKQISEDIKILLRKKPKVLILDYPMGYANSLIARYIDFAVFIDVPLDVLLARKILRDYINRDSSRRKIDNIVESIKTELIYYQTYHRITYINHINTVMPYVDMKIDGIKPVIDNAKTIILAINNITTK